MLPSTTFQRSTLNTTFNLSNSVHRRKSIFKMFLLKHQNYKATRSDSKILNTWARYSLVLARARKWLHKSTLSLHTKRVILRMLSIPYNKQLRCFNQSKTYSTILNNNLRRVLKSKRNMSKLNKIKFFNCKILKNRV